MNGGPIDVESLKAYLAESLPAEAMASIEKALRDSSELRAQLEDVRQDRGDIGLHSLGRDLDPMPTELRDEATARSYLLDALDPDHGDYLKFHIEIVGCPFCGANLADLKHKAEQSLPAARSRQKKIYDSSRGLLSGE